MRVIRKIKNSRWYVKLIVVIMLILAIPALFGLFLFTTSFIRWERERSDLLHNVRRYYHYIQDAEKRKERVTFQAKEGVYPTRIYDRYNKVIGEFFTERKQVVPDSSIPRLLKKAVIAMEDTEFYEHNGVNVKRIANAALENLTKSHTVGGSTITQQLAKLLFTNRERTLHRKIFEFFGAKELESLYSKDDILLLYLNTVYLAHACYGVEEASRLYFNKPVKMLNIYESALLAGMISSPESYSPIKHPDAAKLKHIQTLNRMVELGYVPPSVLSSDFEKFWQDIENKLSAPNISYWKMKVNHAPYFVEFIRQRLQRYFKDDEIISGGLQVYTTLDLNMQRNAQEAIGAGLKRVEKAKGKRIRKWLAKNKAIYKRKLKQAKSIAEEKKLEQEWREKRDGFLKQYRKPIEGALVSMDAANGYVLAMIGGRNFSFENELNRAVFAKRQFGSSMKPFSYGVAIDNNTVHASTVIDDKRRVYNDHGRKWSPHNFGYMRYGKLSVRGALARSVNTIAVETIKRLGPEKVARALEKVFFNQRDFPAILSLPLGSVEISPLDGARIFATIASGGYRVKPVFIRRISDKDGKTLYDFESTTDYEAISRENGNDNMPDTLDFDDTSNNPEYSRSQVLSPGSSYIVTDMLVDVMSKPYGTGYYARLANNFHLKAAGKSGTSDDNRDAWFSGFVKNTVAVVWVGFDNDKTHLPKSMTGGIAAGPIWTDFMKRSFWNLEPYSFPRPGGVISRKVCKTTGQLASPLCEETRSELFIAGAEVKVCEEHGDGDLRRLKEEGYETLEEGKRDDGDDGDDEEEDEGSRGGSEIEEITDDSFEKEFLNEENSDKQKEATTPDRDSNQKSSADAKSNKEDKEEDKEAAEEERRRREEQKKAEERRRREEEAAREQKRRLEELRQMQESGPAERTNLFE